MCNTVPADGPAGPVVPVAPFRPGGPSAPAGSYLPVAPVAPLQTNLVSEAFISLISKSLIPFPTS